MVGVTRGVCYGCYMNVPPQLYNELLREDKLLARALYRAVEVGRMVPEELYRAVAEVLAYVYRARRDAQHRGYRQSPATGGLN